MVVVAWSFGVVSDRALSYVDIKHLSRPIFGSDDEGLDFQMQHWLFV